MAIGVARAAGQAAQRFGIRAQDSGTHVVSESRQRFGQACPAGARCACPAASASLCCRRPAGHGGGCRGGGDLADHAFGELGRGGVYKPQTLNRATVAGEGPAKHLQTCAYSQNRAAGGDRAGNAAIADQVLCRQYLRGILAAADGVNVQGLRDGLAQVDRVNLCGNAAHAGALAQHQGVAIVAIRAQNVRQDQADV